MWQIMTKRRDLVKHGLGMLLLVMFPQSLPVGPYHSIITQSACQAFVDVRQQMQIAYVSLVKDERAERAAEVHARRTMLFCLLLTSFQMTLHLKQ